MPTTIGDAITQYMRQLLKDNPNLVCEHEDEQPPTCNICDTDLTNQETTNA